MILLGGTSGTGKSTVAAELALRLDIGRIQSTDLLREVMRLLISPTLVPEVHMSSYEAWRNIRCSPGTNPVAFDLLVEGYRAQVAKVALAILSVSGADELVQAIAAGDKAMVSRAPGVGPKLAGRIISELKDKVDGLALAAGLEPAVPAAVSGTRADAVSALVNLGYREKDALKAVGKARSDNPDGEFEELIRAALRLLSRA